MVPFPSWEPDQSRFNTNVTQYVKNVLPQPGGWGPVPSFQPTGNAITDPIRLVVSCIADDGTVLNFAGTYDSLYMYRSGVWTNVSPETTPGTPDTLTLPDTEYWGFHQFGDFLLVTNQNDGLLYYDLGNTTGTFNYVPNAPKAKYVTAINEYVAVANMAGASDTIQWCEVGDFFNWEVGENGADFQELPDGGEIRGMTFGETQIFILQRKAIRAIQFVGGSFTFQFSKVNGTHGLAAPASLIPAGETFYFLDESGFHRGPNAEPIGDERVDTWYAANYDQSKVYEVMGGSSPTQNTVWWLLQKTNGVRDMLGYNFAEDRWTFVAADMQYIGQLTTSGTTLEDLDALFPVETGGIDTPDMPSLDSRIWLGGRTSGAGFNAEGYFGFFNGPNMPAVLETPETKLSGENERTFINGHRCIIDTQMFTSLVGTAQIHGEKIAWNQPHRPNDEGLVSSRDSGRLHKFRMETDDAAVWSIAHGVFPLQVPGGRR